MDCQSIRIDEADKHIRLVMLNRPEAKNALSIQMRREISEALASFQEDQTVRAVVFAGAGRVFSAGFDLKEFAREELHRDIFDSSAKYHRDVWNFPKPIIAAVDGPALGGGFDLATLCDIRICTESARFGHPEIKFGGPPLFTPLRWIVGDGAARNLCLTGRTIDAAESLRIGLTSEIVEAGVLFDRALALARQILEAPSETLALAKSYMTKAGVGFEEAFRIEHDDAFRRTLLKSCDL